MSIRETFSNSINLAVINEYDKGAVLSISTCLVTFTMLLVEGMSETGLFRHLSDHVSGVGNFGKSKSNRVVFFFRISKILLQLSEFQQKIPKKFYFFWCNCIWIGFVKLSLLRKGYFSSAPNVLTSSPEIRHVNKRDVFHLNSLAHYQ